MSHLLQHLIQAYCFQFGEIVLTQNVVMMVFRDNKLCISGHCAINKFIIVSIGQYQLEMVIRRYKIVCGLFTMTFTANIAK